MRKRVAAIERYEVEGSEHGFVESLLPEQPYCAVRLCVAQGNQI